MSEEAKKEEAKDKNQGDNLTLGEFKNLAEQHNKNNGVCPYCGYCPTCGRPYHGYYQPYNPNVPYYPYYTWCCGGTMI